MKKITFQVLWSHQVTKKNKMTNKMKACSKCVKFNKVTNKVYSIIQAIISFISFAKVLKKSLGTNPKFKCI